MRYYYITAVEGQYTAVLAGPFATYDEANEYVEAVRTLAVRDYSDAAFAGFGITSSTSYKTLHPRINEQLGIIPCPIGVDGAA